MTSSGSTCIACSPSFTALATLFLTGFRASFYLRFLENPPQALSLNGLQTMGAFGLLFLPPGPFSLIDGVLAFVGESWNGVLGMGLQHGWDGCDE